MFEHFDPIVRGESPWVRRDADGSFRPAHGPPQLLMPGSFNPLHHGHLSLAELAANRFGHPVAFELSIANVDKPDLSRDEVLRRLDQFRGVGPVMVTRAARIEEKAAIFPGCTFVVGADTAARIVHLRYYDNDPARLMRSLDRIRDLGCRFFVGGRTNPDGRFVEVGNLAVPEGYRDLFTGPDEREFRVDISSTEVRHRGRDDSSV